MNDKAIQDRSQAESSVSNALTWMFSHDEDRDTNREEVVQLLTDARYLLRNPKSFLRVARP